MATLVFDPLVEQRIRTERETTGLDRYDEVWDGVHVMVPIPDTEHFELQGRLLSALWNALGVGGLARVAAGGNVSDREDDWTHNYRLPDVIVVLPGSAARDCGTHWCGGPDFCVEVASPGDRSRDKLGFYSRVGVRELLLVDRDPWALELYRLVDERLESVGRSEPGDPDVLSSSVVPVSFRLVSGQPRPRIEVSHDDGAQRWLV